MEAENSNVQSSTPEELQAAGEDFTSMLLLPVSLGGSALAERFGGINATRIIMGAVVTVLAELIVRSINPEHSEQALGQIVAQLQKTVEGGYAKKAEFDAMDASDQKLLTAPAAGNA